MRSLKYAEPDEIAELHAAPWQIDLLKLNPEYCCWGPHEDYMIARGQWNSPVFFESWASFDWGLDDLNECVNFYFDVYRPSKECPKCFDSNGYHALAQPVVNTFYRHQCRDIGRPESDAWNDKITEDECQALIEAGRIPAGSTAAGVNAAQGARGFGHDAINRVILIRARLARLGLPVACGTCDGSGRVYTADAASVDLVLWMLHPRKGCSRGVEIKGVQRDDLPSIYRYLTTALERNTQRFRVVADLA